MLRKSIYKSPAPLRLMVEPGLATAASLVAARKAVAYYDSRDTTGTGRSMIGQHGSWSPTETRVPLLRFGAYG